MPKMKTCTIDQLVIDDEASFRHVALYEDLKEVLRRAKYRFRILPDASTQGGAQWDRALLLNLTYWSADEGGDILVSDHIDADVVAHVAWHHLAHASLGASAASLFLGESIASAFDLYLVGRVLGHAPKSTFLATQVTAIADVAEASGLGAKAFEGLLGTIAGDPERAFADLLELLTRATADLYAAPDADRALAALTKLEGHRFAPLLHHYALSTWVLYARAYAAKPSDAKTEKALGNLAKSTDPIAWLTEEWVAPALGTR